MPEDRGHVLGVEISALNTGRALEIIEGWI